MLLTYTYINQRSHHVTTDTWPPNLRTFRASHGVVPNLITYNAAINACEAGLQWDRALSLLQVMAGSKAALTNVTHI